MQSNGSFLPIAALMLLTGVGIPIMATWNAALGQQLGSPVAATFVLFVVGAILSGIVLAVAGWPLDIGRFSFEQPYIYLGAAFIIFYVLSITWAAPRIGIGNAVFFVLLGQLVAAAAIDHYGLWGAIKSEITARRVIGILVMALGVYLARKNGMIAALLLLAAAPTAEENCDDLPQQPMNLCVHRNFERADAEMNGQWKKTSEQLKQRDREIDRSYDKQLGHFETLLAAQRAWLTYRDQHCLGVSFEARGGSMSPMLLSACKIDLTRERTRQLKALVEIEN